MTTTLNAAQKAALATIQEGHNLFLTGAGGTGKSHTIRAIVDWAKTVDLKVAVTALTGCAALLLGLNAKTIHSWAGIGLARESPAALADAVTRNRHAKSRWRTTQLLIVDEISMMTPELLEKLDLVARRVRGRPALRFGGLQIVFAGDFCQLPPVTKDVSGDGPRFVFEIPLWSTLIDRTVELTEIQRQADPVFQGILNEARLGELSSASIQILKTRKGLPWKDLEIKPTLLYTLNAKIAEINRENMTALEGERRTYTAKTVRKASKDDGSVIPASSPELQAALQRLDNDAPYEATLELCVGAQVMLLTNMDQARGLVNGSRGVLQGYSAISGLPLVKFLTNPEPVLIDYVTWWLADEYETIGRAQIPLKVAYAISIHKSQGATMDCALINIGSSTFEYGQAYVAFSRVRSLEGLYILNFNPTQVCCHPAVRKFYKMLRDAPAPAPTPEPTPEPAGPWTLDGVSPAWRSILDPYMASPAGIQLKEQIMAQAALHPIMPAPADVFTALRVCPDPAAVKVIIVGQDPYPTAGNAHGLAFSIKPSVLKLPASLQNIYKELVADLGLASAPESGSLLPWAEQGVLLLNDSLTVNVGAPLSHAGLGWEELTTRLLAAVLVAAPHVVIVAWGRHAQKKFAHRLIKPHLGSHTLLEAPHPSPLSAHTGFFGSRPFSKINAALVEHGQAPIRWVPPTVL